MNSTIEVGKYTLESLTTGMYEQPLIIYREYIQNAVDSLELAAKNRVITSLDMRIDIVIDEENRFASITDNGMGIPVASAASILLSVGASQKLHSESRGFRGIGRLGGLSYCDELIFRTTYPGENKATVVSYDCKKLKALLIPGANDGMSMEDVVRAVSSVQYIEADSDEHSFVVEMLGIDADTELISIDDVTNYLSQCAPVPYTPAFFMSDEIHRYLQAKGFPISEFPVFIGRPNGKMKPIHKAFKRHYTAGRERIDNTIYQVTLLDVVNEDGKLIAIGWYANTDWLGTIHDDSIRGIRLRKGNIQIGDDRTLNSIFSQARFNGWNQGEIYVIDENLIPNARRDNFEQNQAYHSLMRCLKNGIGAELSTAIGKASRERNDPSKKAINEALKAVAEGNAALEEGFASGVSKQRIVESLNRTLETTKDAAERKSRNGETAVKPKNAEALQDAVQQLEATLDRVEESSHYKTDVLKGRIGNKEKRILTIVTNVLSDYFDDQLVNRIIDQINEVILHGTRKG